MKDPGSTEAKSAKRRLQRRVLLALGSVAVYAAVFFPIYALISRSAIALSILPVALFAVMFGAWAGLSAGLALIPVNIALIATAERSSPGLFIGQIFWVSHAVFVAIGIAMGHLSHIRAKLASELAERQRVEQALRESEAKYRNVAERATDGIAIIQDNLIKYCNQQTAQMVGYTVQEILDVPFAEFFFPEQRDLLLARYQRRLEGKDEPQRYETVLVHRDGHHIPVEINASLIEYQGHPATLGIVRDMTAHKQAQQALRESEERLRTLIECIPVEFWAKDTSGHYIMQNSANRQVYGDTIGLTLDDIDVDREIRAEWRAQDERVFAGETVHSEHVLSMGGEKRVFQQVVAPVLVEDRVVAILGIIFDITEQRKAEEALRHAKESAEAANRVRSTFLANVSHELRTPLNAILGFSELMLRDTNLSDEQEKSLTTIHDSGNDLLQLINQILALSRDEHEQQTAPGDTNDPFHPQALAQSSYATKHERETSSPQTVAQETAQQQSQLEEPNLKALPQPQVVKSLASMPDRWLADLHQAIIEGDIGWMSSLIDQISDRPLAEQLAALVDSFQHSELLGLLEQAKDSSLEEYNGQAPLRS